jgi:hypothetical protein
MTVFPEGRMKLRSRHVQLRQGAAAVGDAPVASGSARIGRRRLLAAVTLAGLGVAPARAHHGWSSFDTGRPVYLEGRVGAVQWRNPHAELQLEVPAGLKLPPDLATRPVPAQSASVDGPALLAKAVVPTRTDRVWTIELAPLTRMNAWKVPQLKTGDAVSMVGFTFIAEKGDPILRVEYLFVNGRAYGLRSSPAG